MRPASTHDADVVIVGAGSAGCALAWGLARSGHARVVVLEAGGGDRHPWVQMPLGYGKTFYDRRFNWAYQTEPDAGLDGRRDYWPRGKLVGGSSAINAMVYIRGSAADFRRWHAAGNPGWDWPDVLDAYRRLEASPHPGELRGHDGPLHTSDASAALHPLTRAFLDAGRQIGLPLNGDFNGASQEGVGVYELTTWRGRRNSAARALLRPAERGGRVQTLCRAHATRVLLEDGRATGVAYLRAGTRHVIRAPHVVLCAGAIGSVQLLQLSGIGPPALLQARGIEVRLANASVGAHLQDHQGLNYTYRARCASLNEVLRPWWGKLRVGLRYLLRGDGPLALSLNQAGGFVRTAGHRAEPNMQLYMQAITTLKPAAGERPLLTPDPFPGFSLGLSSVHPRSRGHIAIASSDARDPPHIHAGAFSAAEDMAEMIEAVKLLRRLAATPALAPLIEAEMLPGPDCRDDDALEADIRARSGTVFHPCGTCRMGNDAASAVVDARLRVHGLQGLRVADASVFPHIISGNTSAPAMMVGLRAADFINEELQR